MTTNFNKSLCKQKENIAYKSCVDSYFNSKDKADIIEYWLFLFEKRRFCEAKGVEKALEIIDLYEDLNAENKEKDNNKES